MTRINTRSSQLRENNTNEEMNYQFEEQDSLHTRSSNKSFQKRRNDSWMVKNNS